MWNFLRIGTSRAFEQPLTILEAQAAIASWLAQPSAGVLKPSERHWDILSDVLRTGRTSGPLVMDAVLAAIAIEHGATLCTTDRDFARFPDVRWTNPLAA
jgi:toxin-antitoxin system PIN domain toxin